ncbi:MAG: PAS domain S-box protein, partial [Gammaproteobacteria bacterium]|nr:PAS domain S-box protein [Gammaproteobacteria bacterium]
MNNFPTTVLLVEADLMDASLIEDVLAGAGGNLFYVESVTCLADALRRLARVEFDVVLLDLMLADAQGMEVFNQVSAVATKALIVVLSTTADEALANQAVLCGAHDYLVKSHVEAYWLPRALQYLIERKVSTDALRISEARFRSMSDASPLGIFVSDAQGNCVYTNQSYQKISGLNSEQSLGTNWSKAIHPEDRQRVLADWQTATRGLVSFQTEFRFLQANNRVAWTRVNSAVMQDGNRLLGLVQTVEDITERKKTERVLRASEEALYEEKERAEVTLNSIGDAVLTTDIAGNVRYLNQVAEMMTGWSCEDAMGQPLAKVFNVIDDDTRKVIPDPAQRAMAENRVVGLSLNSVLIRRDGSETNIEDSVAPIHNRDGQVSGAVIVFHDV